MDVKDRITSAKHTLTGSGLGKAISKATSHEIIGPKRKHVDYILGALETDNVSIPNTADMLFDRCNNSSWVVVFKSLVTFHHIMSNGNERFIQYIASKSATWMLGSFLDKGGVQGYDMSHIIRKYSSYLMEKAHSYRVMGFDFCKIARGREGGILRNMDSPKLLKALPAIQVQLDSLVATEITSNDLTNGVISAAFMLLFRDLIRLFACYNDGIINLLEKFFEMKKPDCKASLEIYKKFLARMDRVSEFLKSAEDAGIDKGDIPDLSKAPNSLLEALEMHLQSLEKGKTNPPPERPVTIPAFNIDQWAKTAEKLAEIPNPQYHSMSTTLPTTATASPSPYPSDTEVTGDYLEQQKKLLEMFNKTKEQAAAKPPAPPSPQAPAKLAPQMQASPQTFDMSPPAPAEPQNKASDDLLCLSLAPAQSQMPFTNPPLSNPYGQPAGMNFFANQPAVVPVNNRPIDFNNPFHQPQTHSSSTPNLLDGDILTPESPTLQLFETAKTPSQESTNHVDARPTDVNKGLERVALSLDGLNMSPATVNMQKGGHQWNPSSNQSQVKTGGANFHMAPTARSTLPPTSPLGGFPGGMGQQPRFPVMGAPVQQYGYGMPRPMMGYQQPMGGVQPQAGGGMFGANFGYNQRLATSNPTMNNNDLFK